MHKLIAAVTTAISLGFVSAASAQPVGLGTSPQGTLTYAVGAAVAKIAHRGGPLAGACAAVERHRRHDPAGEFSGEIDLGFCQYARAL